MMVCPQGKGAGHEGAALQAIDAVMKSGIENASETQVNKFPEGKPYREARARVHEQCARKRSARRLSTQQRALC